MIITLLCIVCVVGVIVGGMWGRITRDMQDRFLKRQAEILRVTRRRHAMLHEVWTGIFYDRLAEQDWAGARHATHMMGQSTQRAKMILDKVNLAVAL